MFSFLWLFARQNVKGSRMREYVLQAITVMHAVQLSWLTQVSLIDVGQTVCMCNMGSYSYEPAHGGI